MDDKDLQTVHVANRMLSITIGRPLYDFANSPWFVHGIDVNPFELGAGRPVWLPGRQILKNGTVNGGGRDFQASDLGDEGEPSLEPLLHVVACIEFDLDLHVREVSEEDVHDHLEELSVERRQQHDLGVVR